VCAHAKQETPIILAAIPVILLLRLIAMAFTDEVKWTLFDFVVAGALLLAAGLAYEVLARKGGTPAYRLTAARESPPVCRRNRRPRDFR
jgi:hypothetical protein